MSPAPAFVRIPGSHHPGTRVRLVPESRDPGSVLILGQVTQYGNPYLICITIFIHALHEPHQPLLNAKFANSLQDDTSGYMIECIMPFPDRQRPRTVSHWRHKIFCNWRTMDMASVVLHPCMKPNCMSTMRICCHRKFLATFSRTFMTWSSNKRPR